MANVEFGTGKTVLILTIVAACFAVLWPKIFYPMLVSSPSVKPNSDNDNGCCDVIFETDVNAIKIMSEMCGSIFKKHQDLDPKLTKAFQDGKYSKKLVDFCRSEVMNICGIDIAEILNEKVRLGHSYRQILDEIRSYNISVCLRQNFGVNPGSIGTPRRMRLWGPAASRHLRQERPLHLRPEMMHPALRERGRAIPQSSLPAKKVEDEGSPRPPPIPGMRPPMGGAGHVVPPPKVGATMSIVMPLYTIGIVIFSMYTIMKVFVRKTGNSDNYKDFSSDPEFRRVVFADEYSNGCAGSGKEESLGSRIKRDSPQPLFKAPSDDATRLGWKERDTRDVEIDYLRKRLEETERAMERIVAQIGTIPATIESKPEIDSGESSCRDLNKLQPAPSDRAILQQHQGFPLVSQTEKNMQKKSRKGKIQEFVVMTAITGLLAGVDQQLSREGDTQTQYSTDLKEEKRRIEEICTEEITASGKKDLNKPEQVDKRGKGKLEVSVGEGEVDDEPVGDDSKPKVKVMGVETVAECEGGQRWSRPATPTLGVGSTSTRGTTKVPEEVEASNIFLEGALPTQSQLLVTDSKTQAVPQEEGSETPVILSGKAVIEDIGNVARDEQQTEDDGEKSDKADDDGTTQYTTATMSEEAEVAEIEGTRADEALDTVEDEEELEDDGHEWNGEERPSQLISDEQEED